MSIKTGFLETTIDGPKTRRWLIEARECAEMNTHRIARLGMDEALPPYRRVRMSPGGSFVLACVRARFCSMDAGSG